MNKVHTLEATYNRVGVFQAFEVQVEAAPNEWVRDKRKSTLPIHELINKFLADNKASVISVSPPDIKLVAASAIGDTNKTRTYSCAVSVIYRPQEIVINEGVQQESDADVDLTNIPEEYREVVKSSIREELKSASRSVAAKTKSTATRGSVQRRPNRPDDSRNRGAGVPVIARPRTAPKPTRK